MIVSHEHRFIFIKTHKTAGTSIEIALSRYCGPDDILTPISEEDERRRRKLGQAPRHYRGELWRSTPRDLARMLRSRKWQLFYNHMPARAVRRLVGEAIWNEYFTFCFERNPWDKVVSAYFWDCRDELNPVGSPKTSFSDYLTSRRRLDVRDWPRYTIGGSVAVKRVGRYESLLQDLAEICARVGLDYDGWLPHAKGSARAPGRDYRNLYGPEERELVASQFRHEIDHFGYRF